MKQYEQYAGKYVGHYEDSKTLQNWAKSFHTKQAALNSLKKLKQTEKGFIWEQSKYSGKFLHLTNSLIAWKIKRPKADYPRHEIIAELVNSGYVLHAVHPKKFNLCNLVKNTLINLIYGSKP